MQLASDWAAAPVVTDGASSDWRVGSAIYADDAGAQMSVSNDSSNLYVLFRFRSNNERWSRPCSFTGLTLWLGANGKNTQDHGLRFADGPSAADGPGGGETQRQPGSFHELDGRLVVLGKGDVMLSELPADGSRGPSAAFLDESGICSYEIRVPLRATEDNAFSAGARPGSTVMVGVTAGLSQEQRQAMRERMGGMHGGGHMGGSGGPTEGAGGGRGGPSDEDPRPGRTAPTNPSIWLRVALSSGYATGR